MISFLGKKKKPEGAFYEFLPGIEGIISKPPSFTIWLIPIVLSLLLLALILWLSFSRIDIISPSLAVIIPDSRLQEIQAKESNRVEKILVEDGDSVRKGQKLVNFYTKDIDNEISSITKEMAYLQTEILTTSNVYNYLTGKKTIFFDNDLKLLKDYAVNKSLATSLADAEKQNIKSEISFLSSKEKSMEEEIRSLSLELESAGKSHKYAVKNYRRQKKLFYSRVIAGEEFEKNEVGFLESESRVALLKQSIEQKKANLQSLKNEKHLFMSQKNNEYLARLTETTKQLDLLASLLQKLESQRGEKFLVSPIKGRVNEVLVFGSGQVVQSGETVMRVVPDDSPLQARAKVLNRDIGFVNIDQKVNVKIDSFTFTKYGYISGTIFHISDAAVEDEQLGSYYPIIINLDRKYVDIGNGKRVQLKPGMTATVDIQIGKRRLAEYIIAPLLRYKDEALREK